MQSFYNPFSKEPLLSKEELRAVLIVGLNDKFSRTPISNRTEAEMIAYCQSKIKDLAYVGALNARYVVNVKIENRNIILELL